MKTKKLNFKELQGALSRDEMKKIMAGTGGSCQDFGKECNTPVLNCCSGLVCASHVCQHPTL